MAKNDMAKMKMAEMKISSWQGPDQGKVKLQKLAEKGDCHERQDVSQQVRNQATTIRGKKKTAMDGRILAGEWKSQTTAAREPSLLPVQKNEPMNEKPQQQSG